MSNQHSRLSKYSTDTCAGSQTILHVVFGGFWFIRYLHMNFSQQLLFYVLYMHVMYKYYMLYFIYAFYI